MRNRSLHPPPGDRSEGLSILAFAYIYPPEAGSGTYRTLYFANEWARAGDAVTVITVDERCILPGTDVDARLCDEIHPSIQVVRATARRPLRRLLRIRDSIRSLLRAGHERPNSIAARNDSDSVHRNGVFDIVKDTITDLLSCPDEQIGWVPDAVRRALKIVMASEVDCIYATGGPWSGLLAALRLHRRTGIPMVIDLRDPWVGNPHFLRRSPLCRGLQRRLEYSCVAASSFIVANTEELQQDLVHRYPNVPSGRFVTVTNGFEEMRQGTDSGGSQFMLLHTGNFYGSRTPSNLFRAVGELLTSGAIPGNVLRLRLVGDVGTGEVTKRELCSEPLHSVLEVTPRMPHDDAMALQQQASVLVLVQTGYVTQVPRKLYEYLSVGRPVLAITESHSATASIIRRLRAGYVVEDDVDSIKRALLTLFSDWQEGGRSNLDFEALDAYRNRNLAAQLRQLLRGCCNTVSAGVPHLVSSRVPPGRNGTDGRV